VDDVRETDEAGQGRTEGPGPVWEIKGRAASALVFLLLIAGGALAGLVLGWAIGAGSDFSRVTGILLLPVSAVVGVLLWQLIVKIYLVSHIGRGLVKGFRQGGLDGALKAKIDPVRTHPPGTFIFVLVPLVVCLVGGILVGFTPTDRGFLSVVGLYLLTGLLYGLLQRRLVRKGYYVILQEHPDTIIKKSKREGRAKEGSVENLS
jgi:hypothetical protein